MSKVVLSRQEIPLPLARLLVRLETREGVLLDEWREATLPELEIVQQGLLKLSLVVIDNSPPAFRWDYHGKGFTDVDLCPHELGTPVITRQLLGLINLLKAHLKKPRPTGHHRPLL